MARRARSPQPRFLASGRNLFKASLALLFMIVAVGLTVAVSGANILGVVRPDLALRLMPFDARSKARLAEQKLLQIRTDARAAGEAGQLAREALTRDATIAGAWRTLGLSSSTRNQTSAASLFRVAERMSRRDLPTQLWLIEESVRRNDIRTALRHYDVALRTSSVSYDLLLPNLVRAMSEDAIVLPLAQLLRTAPPWRRWFLVKMTEAPPPGGNAARLLELMKGSGSLPDQDMVALLVAIYAGNRQYAAATRIYGLIHPSAQSSTSLLRNGGFENANPAPPLDWKLDQNDDRSAEQRLSGNGRSGHSLQINATSGASGVTASQMLMLPPGDYELMAEAGSHADARPAKLQWQILCAHDQAIRLLTFDVPTSQPAGQRHQAGFRVPGTCPAQWLALSVRADEGTDGRSAWLDSVQIRRR